MVISDFDAKPFWIVNLSFLMQGGDMPVEGVLLQGKPGILSSESQAPDDQDSK